jgi:hypothetical protein
MPKHSNKPKKSRSPSGSLLAPAAMGGIVAGKGFDFQTRFAACNIPLWLLEAAFHQLFFEGTGDIDIRFTEAGKSSRIHIQVKDHDVQPGELKTVIEQFSRLDLDLPDTYKCFNLVCPSLSATSGPLRRGLRGFAVRKRSMMTSQMPWLPPSRNWTEGSATRAWATTSISSMRKSI